MKRRSVALSVALGLLAAALVPTAAANAVPATTTVTGTVTSGGTPVPDVSVGWYEPSTGDSQEFDTDGSGVYTVTLPTDSHPYFLKVNLDEQGYYPDNGEFAGTFFGAGDQHAYAYQLLTAYTSTSTPSATLNIALDKTGTVSGSAASLTSSSVTLTTAGGDYVTSTEANSSGAFTFPDLVPGHYRVTTDAYSGSAYLPYVSSVLTVTAGGTTTVHPTLVKGAVIAGKITAGGKAVKNTSVYASPKAAGGTYADTTTNSKGAYSIKGLKAGTYTVSFGGVGTLSSSTGYVVTQKTVKSVKTAHTTTVNFATARGSRISGTVKAGKKSKSYQVAAVSKAFSATTSGFTGKKNTFVFNNLPKGKYTVYTTDSLGKKYGTKKVTVSAAGAKVKAGAIALSKNAVKLSGKVSGASSGYIYVTSKTSGLYTYASISKSGKYSAAGLIPGKQFVSVYPDKRVPKYTSVTVKKNTTKTLSGGKLLGTLTGTLTLAGAPVQYATFGLSSKTDFIYVYTEDGSFSETGSAGSYAPDSTSLVISSAFQHNSSFYARLPFSTVTLVSGKTTKLGSVALAVRG